MDCGLGLRPPRNDKLGKVAQRQTTRPPRRAASLHATMDDATVRLARRGPLELGRSLQLVLGHVEDRVVGIAAIARLGAGIAVVRGTSAGGVLRPSGAGRPIGGSHAGRRRAARSVATRSAAGGAAAIARL